MNPHLGTLSRVEPIAATSSASSASATSAPSAASRLVASLPLALLFVADPAWSQIQAGLYRIESRLTAQISGRAIEMPPVRFERCITPDAVGALDPGAERSGCSMVEQSSSGNRASWTISCEGPTQGTMHYEAEFGAGSYQSLGTADMRYPDGSRAQLRIEQTGERVGACP